MAHLQPSDLHRFASVLEEASVNLPLSSPSPSPQQMYKYACGIICCMPCSVRCVLWRSKRTSLSEFRFVVWYVHTCWYMYICTGIECNFRCLHDFFIRFYVVFINCFHPHGSLQFVVEWLYTQCIWYLHMVEWLIYTAYIRAVVHTYIHVHVNVDKSFQFRSKFGSQLWAEVSMAFTSTQKITVLTGAGISAESGIPTFRGEGGLWRTWNAMVNFSCYSYLIAWPYILSVLKKKHLFHSPIEGARHARSICSWSIFSLGVLPL
jgi:hypothetical protein